jgi:ubiquinone/menaquinone biosynthesis C-methylase UbiE
MDGVQWDNWIPLTIESRLAPSKRDGAGPQGGGQHMNNGAESKESSRAEAREACARKASGVFPIQGAQAREAPPAEGPVSAAPEQTPAAWSSCTDAYEEFAAAVTQPFASDAVRLVRLGPGVRVLDVATGTGAFALTAARRGANVLATDFSETMLGRLAGKARALRGGTLQTALMDGQALALADNTFDVTASLFGVMFFPDQTQGLKELFRVLRPGGQAVLATWAPPARVEMMRLVGEAAMGAMVELPPEQGAHWTALSEPRRIHRTLSEVGFARVHVIPVAHLCTFDRAETVAELLVTATPSVAALWGGMCDSQRKLFVDVLVQGFHERQGDGPFAMSCEGLLTVATKAVA